MYSFASLRYGLAFEQFGGPVAELVVSRTKVLGRDSFQANATLAERCQVKCLHRILYSNCDGSGTDVSPMVARHKAISEAIERWAFFATHRSEQAVRYGFHVDPSSNGMAAFPGVFQRQARPAALMEAAERYTIIQWWEGRLNAEEVATPWSGVRALKLKSTAPGVTVILFRKSPAGHIAYGQAAALDFNSACKRAAVEMERHDQVLQTFAEKHPGKCPDFGPDRSFLYERRSWFFSQPSGHALFLERLKTLVTTKGGAAPRIIFDGAIPGPWQRYASVWRVAYEPPSEQFLAPRDDYFFW